MLSLTLNFTSGIAELTLDHLQGAGFQMVWEVLPLDRILSTFVWALQGVLLADRPVLIGDFDVGGFMVTVLAGEWTVGAIICLVPLKLTSLVYYHHRSKDRPLSQTGTLPQQSSGSDVCQDCPTLPPTHTPGSCLGSEL